MKTSSLKFRSALFFYLLAISINGLVAQISLTSNPAVTPEMMVENILMEGVSYSNVTIQGHYISRGIFTNGKTTNLGLQNGIFLTSGIYINIPGPNNTGSASAVNNLPGHPLLTALAGYQTFDASVLSFDFVPETDTLRIRYVFGSEEYNEWVGSPFNDVFGCFITGPDPSGGYYIDKNIAIIPGTLDTGISINTVNNGYATTGTPPTGPCMNCEYFTDNTGGATLQYDAKTVVMTAWVHVVPCEEYSIIFGVADGGDSVLDAGVFIEENSIGYPKITALVVLNPPGLTEHMVEGFVSADVLFRLPHVPDSNTTVCFEITGTATYGVDYEWIDNCVIFEAGFDTVSVRITPLFDGIIEGDETVILILENSLGCQNRYDTIELIIQDYNEMYFDINPEQVICPGDEITIWATLAPYTGYPPFSYLWEPGSFTSDTITVSPDETTLYRVICTDLFMQTVTDSVLISVLPGHLNEMLAFTFEATNNPSLPGNISGTISGDSVLVIVPAGQETDNLIASFIVSDCSEPYIGDEQQISGLTANDFTNPVIYEVIAANGDIKEWVVKVDVVSAVNEHQPDQIVLFPNPASEHIHIRGAGVYRISLFNTIGREIINTVIDDESTLLNISHLDPGLYYLRFSGDGQQFVKKVVVFR